MEKLYLALEINLFFREIRFCDIDKNRVGINWIKTIKRIIFSVKIY